jgi:hypothetical protein
MSGIMLITMKADNTAKTRTIKLKLAGRKEISMNIAKDTALRLDNHCELSPFLIVNDSERLTGEIIS